jgi:glycyl-tRNA synthetase beta chain
VGQGDEVPTAPVTVAVALADKLDTLVGFFGEEMEPTGSKDPFALRRQAIATINLIVLNQIPMNLFEVLRTAIRPFALRMIERTFADSTRIVDEILDKTGSVPRKVAQDIFDRAASDVAAASLGAVHSQRISKLLTFFADRLKVQQKEAGVRHDLIDAVFALGGEDDLVRLLARVHALQAFIATEDGKNLHAGYKRAANILRKEDWQGIEGEIARTGEEDPLAMVDDPDLAPVIATKMADRHAAALAYAPEPAEAALIAALAEAGPRAEAAVAGEDFAAAMTALASLRAPIDAFFDAVTVNDPDPAKRQARLGLLDQFRAAVHKVADFSRIEG